MHRIHTFCFLLLALAVTAWPRAAAAITLVEDGKPASVIITADTPVAVARKAAEELQYHLKHMTGAEVPIVGESEAPDSDATRVYVGRSAALEALGVDAAALEKESFIVRTIDGALVLVGDDAGSRADEVFSDNAHGGTMYAVFDFLHDELGCRWLWPGPTGEVIPTRKTVEVSELSVQETPQLIRRHFRSGVRIAEREEARGYYPRYMASTLEAMHEPLMNDELLWLKRMRMGQSDKPAYGHAFTQWYDRYHDEHPEVFAMQADGTRGLPNDSYRKSFVKMCASSDKLIDMLIEQFMAQRERNPNYRWLNACENDGGLGFCVCEDCKALDVKLSDEVREKLRARGWSDELIESEYQIKDDGLPNSLTNRYFHFYNKLARRLAEVAPDAYVVTYAYVRYLYAPVDLEVEPNILVGLIGFNNYPMTEEQHKREIDALQAWRDAGVEALFFRPNSFYFAVTHGVPWDATTQMAGDFSQLLDGGILSTDFDRLNGHWSTAPRIYYVLGRQHWDTKATVEELEREFAEGFGPAADSVDAYFDHWEKVHHDAFTRPDINEIAKQADDFGGRIGLRKSLSLVLTDADFKRAHDLLAEARAAAEKADDASALQKIEVLELGLQHGELMMEATKFSIDRNYSQPVYYKEQFPIVQKIFALREKLGAMRAHNVYWLNNFEFTIHDAYGTRMFYDFEGRDFEPVMTPPREDWKFVPDPKDAGETEKWYANRITPANALYGFEYPSYRHLFFSTWDQYNPVNAWMRRTGEKEVVNGWYQIEFAVPEKDLEGSVLYFPYIVGDAKIWIGDKLVKEVSAAQGAGDEAVTISPADVGIRPNKAFRLTIKVNSPGKPGGLIGPVYIARPTSSAGGQ